MNPKNTPDAPQDPASDAVAAAGATAGTKPPVRAKADEAAKQAKPAKVLKSAKPTVAVKRTQSKKTPVAAAVVTVAAPTPADKTPKVKAQPKDKLVRDSFTMPRADFALIAQLKDRALGFQRPAKKSELLRAGLQALAAMGDDALRALLAQLPTLKTGRPRKGD